MARVITFTRLISKIGLCSLFLLVIPHNLVGQTIKISQLPEATTPSQTDVLPIVSGGATKKIKLSNLLGVTVVATPTKAAIQSAIDALPAAGGTIVLLPQYYTGTTALNPGTKQVVLQGAGWFTLVGATFGDSQWVAASAIKGTVIQNTSTAADGILINGTNHRGLILKDLAILGPGSGSTVGINYDGGATSTLQNRTYNVFVANFSKGVRFDQTFDNTFYDLHVWGCTKGLAYDGAGSITDQYFFRVDLQVNGTAIDAANGNQQVFYGGLIQSNTTGINLFPAASSQLTNWTFNDLWSEGNTTGVVMDTTNGAITGVRFRGCRESSSYTLAPNIVTGVISRLKIQDCSWGPVTLTLAAGISDVVIDDTTLAAFTPGGATRISRIAHDGVTSLASVGVTITPAATVTPNFNNGPVQEITVDQNTTINVPSNPIEDSTITFIIRQDGTGGRTITWGSGWHVSWSDTGNTANKYSTISFRYIGSGQWIQLGAQSPYFA